MTSRSRFNVSSHRMYLSESGANTLGINNNNEFALHKILPSTVQYHTTRL